MNGNSSKSSASLYIHIPFCSQKCDYCHFYVLPDKLPLKLKFMEGLKLEWERIKSHVASKKIESLYFGGGTPYLLGAPALKEILSWLSSCRFSSSFEVTLEANPENIELSSLCAYREIGVNRLSIGIQSLDDGQLATLSRRHTAIKGIKSVEMAAQAGFENISIDLMYDLPHQTLASWQRTIKTAASLPITHLSLYNLTIEPQTVFFKYRESLAKQIPEEELSKAMYEEACNLFEAAGLKQYEISAFARNGNLSIHNAGYWTGRPFFGLGPSAFSYWDEGRFRNVANLSKYLGSLQKGSSPIDFSEKLPQEKHQRELLAIALRLLRGVNLEEFQAQHGALSFSCLKDLESLAKEGFLTHSSPSYRLTRKGILFYDSVASELV